MGIGVYVGQKDRARFFYTNYEYFKNTCSRGKLLKVLNDNEDTVEEVSSFEVELK